MHPLLAVEGLRRVRGGSQAHVIRAQDGLLYVCKMLNNPQSNLVLANELIATRLAQHLGLSVPEPAFILATPEFFANNPSVRFETHTGLYEPTPGLQYGSKMIDGHATYDFLPATFPRNRVNNLRSFAGILALDKWVCQADGRQVVYFQHKRGGNFDCSFIDHGYSFNCDWTFPDSPLRGVHGSMHVYQSITGWDDFEPWISRIENISPTVLTTIAGDVPDEWLPPKTRDDLADLCDSLYRRRQRVRDLITDFRKSSRQPFPDWNSLFSLSVTAHPDSRTLAAV